MAIIFANEYGPVGEKLPVDIEEDNTNDPGQLQFKHVVLLSATYRKLIHWLQVLMNARDGRLTFV